MQMILHILYIAKVVRAMVDIWETDLWQLFVAIENSRLYQ